MLPDSSMEGGGGNSSEPHLKDKSQGTEWQLNGPIAFTPGGMNVIN
jgi:hypothetical protein